MKKIFINSLPKSGTHMLAKCMELFGYNGKTHLGSGVVLNNRLASKLRRITVSPVKIGYIIGIDSPVEISRTIVEGRLKRVVSGSYCTGHVGYTFDLLNYLEINNFSMILVLRDPRSVLASFIPYVLRNKNHFLNSFFNQLSEAERFDVALNGYSHAGGSLQPLKLRCLCLSPWIESSNVLKVKFEDLVGSKGGGSDDAQENALQKISVWTGAAQDKIPYVAQNLFGTGKKTFRKGQVDSWKSELPDTILQRVEEELADILDSWGYKKQEITPSE